MSYDKEYEKRSSAKVRKNRPYSDSELSEIRILIKKYMQDKHPNLSLNSNEANYVSLAEAINDAFSENIISARYIYDIYQQNRDNQGKNIKRMNALVQYIQSIYGLEKNNTLLVSVSETSIVLKRVESIQESLSKMTDMMQLSLLEAKRKDEELEKKFHLFQQKRLADEARIKELEKEVSQIVTLNRIPNNYLLEARKLFKQRDYGAYQKVLDLSIKSNMETVAETYFLKAKGYEATMHYTKALQAYQMAQKMQPKKIEYTIALSGFLVLLGDYKTPVSMLQKLLLFLEKSPVNERITAVVYNKLGNIWRERNDFRKASDYYEHALKINSTLFGEMHSSIVETLQNIGLLELSNALFNQSISTFQRAIEINTNLKEKNDGMMASLLNHQGLSYLNTGQHDKAISSYSHAIEISKIIYGKKHPTIANALNNMGEAHRGKGEYDKALDFYLQALNMNKRIFKVEHPRIAGLLNNIGLILEKSGKYRKAINYFQQAINMNKKIFGDIHTTIGNNLNNMGLSWFYLKNNNKALDCYNESIEIFKKIHKRNHPHLARVYSNIGGVFYEKKQYSEAIEYYKLSLDIEIEFGNANKEPVAYPYANLGQVYDAQGFYDDAILYYNKALKIFKKISLEHPFVAHAYNNLGESWNSKGNLKKAILYYDMAIEIFEKKLGKQHFYTIKAQKAKQSILNTWKTISV